MTSHRILLTGGAGFVGSRVAAQLATPQEGASPSRLRLLRHNRSLRLPRTGAVETRHGDLRAPGSLRGVCDGVETLVHMASQIGGTPERCREVNDRGTGALLAEAARAGVSRIIHLGTTAVYRDEPHRGAAEGEPPVGPTSPTSVSRLAGERQVLAAGGTVVRPHLVYGSGDIWVVPALVELMTALPHWVEGGTARISMISADSLARAIAALARQAAPPPGRVLHAAHPDPVRSRDLMSTVARELGMPVPAGVVTHAEALRRLGGGESWRRRLSLLTVDHWYDSARLWSLVGAAHGAAFTDDFPGYAPSYRAALAGRHVATRPA